MVSLTAVDKTIKAVDSIMGDLKRSNPVSLNITQATPMPSKDIQTLITSALSLESGKL